MLDAPSGADIMRAGHLLAAVAIFGLALSFAAHADDSDTRNDRVFSPWERKLYDTQVYEIPLWTQRHDTVTRVVVVTASCAFRSDTRVITRRNVNKIGITQDIPVIGQLFGDTPRQGQLTYGNQVGLAYLDHETLYVDLRPRTSLANPDRRLLDALANGPPAGRGAPFAIAPTTPLLASFSVVNRDFEFVIPSANFAAVAPPGKTCGDGVFAHWPALAPLFPQPIGTAHLLTGRLIVLVPPSIIAGY
jgi:hypothetical protein